MKKKLLSFLIASIFVFTIFSCTHNVFQNIDASLISLEEKEQLKQDLTKAVNYLNNHNQKIVVIEWHK